MKQVDGPVAKWKRGSLQNFYAGVRFPSVPHGCTIVGKSAWWGGRVVDCTGLENQQAKASRVRISPPPHFSNIPQKGVGLRDGRDEKQGGERVKRVEELVLSEVEGLVLSEVEGNLAVPLVALCEVGHPPKLLHFIHVHRYHH